uniref:Sulfotransferase domain-containing protein n=1 Tax=Magallana gigas TaxID=29159 RepID=K1P7I4_MAGGI
MVVTKDKNDKMAGLDIRKLDYPVYEGIGLLKFPNVLENAGQTIQNIKDLKLGPDSVILATFPRSGTHWVYEITHMLLTKKAEYATKSREAVYLEGLPDLGPLQSYNHIVSTHLPFQWLPQQHLETEVMFGGWFNYNKAFIRESEVRKDQIIMLQYEKLQRNTIGELKRLAKFLDVKDADQLFPEIAEKCGFDNLKAADERVRNDSTMAEIINVILQSPPVAMPLCDYWQYEHNVARQSERRHR